ncbi:sulfatase [Horticoccus sp. 23ND18S-11]|uniref:sulfatase n=1 Tax=Horticoccus sp. 23ND18S-11 TaxID=3391832 RepID=UPI0039C8E145
MAAARSAAATPAQPRPNVLFILIDDHAANLTSVRNESPVRTPNFERLAARGAWFERAYCDAPVCAASRNAFLTGVHAAKSGVYYNSQAGRRTTAPIAKAITLQRHFLDHGYLTAGYGKIAHTGYQDDYLADYTPGYFKGHGVKRYVTYIDTDLLRFVLPDTVRIPDPKYLPTRFAALPDDWDRDDPTKFQQDTEQAERAVTFLRQKHDGPFFLSVGFWRPHSERIVPKRYFDLYPLDAITLPPGYRPDDLDDVPAPGRWRATAQGTHAAVVNAGLLREYLRSYYAATTYVDEQVGRVLNALEASPYASNTLVVFASDNGYNAGEKNLWAKFALWDQTCRVVFGISGPGIRPQSCPTPVSLIDIYPTLVTFCGLPPPGSHTLDGVDLSPILRGERSERGQPVLSTYGLANHSIRDGRFRYIRYRNGDEELYDHEGDRYEWTNLASDPRYADIKTRLARALPTVDAPEVEPARPWDGSELNAAAFEKFAPGTKL